MNCGRMRGMVVGEGGRSSGVLLYIYIYIYIGVHKQNAPSMNREQGYQLPPIYHQLLLPEQFPRRKTSRDQEFIKGRNSN